MVLIWFMPYIISHYGRWSQFFVHFAISTPPGYPWGSRDLGETTELGFLGLGYDHAVLKQPEAKNLSKSAKIR